ncbi:MAG: sugar phosphate isomerase/epimerase [Chitinophagaceae bacterium]|nr:MAG: sugar phosphate isomerase/epimerase [Chitinophagaceae bacterium]
MQLSFLQRTLFLFSGILLGVAVQAQVAVGLQLYSFRNQLPKDVPGMLQKISSMGFRYIEGGGTYKLSKEEYKSLLLKNNLQVVSYGASFEELEKDPQAVAEKAAFFGALYVMCSWVPHKGEVFTIEDTKRAVAVFNAAGKVLKEKGIQFMYHAHGYEFQHYEGGTFFDYMLQHMDPAYANFQMDVFWFKNSGQDPAANLLKYPNRFLTLHLKDRKLGTPDNVTAKADVETNVELGTGDVNIAAVMEAAKKIGIKYAFIEDESSRSEEQVPRSLAYVNGLK